MVGIRDPLRLQYQIVLSFFHFYCSESLIQLTRDKDLVTRHKQHRCGIRNRDQIE